MKGYEVWTNDDHRVSIVDRVVGDVVLVKGYTVILSSPLLGGGDLLRWYWWKAVPRELTGVDDEKQLVRTTFARELFDGVPKVNGRGKKLDFAEIADFWGRPVHD